MSRRKNSESASRPAKPSVGSQPGATPPTLERWPQPMPRLWLTALAAFCVVGWLIFLAYLAIREAS